MIQTLVLVIALPIALIALIALIAVLMLPAGSNDVRRILVAGRAFFVRSRA